MTIHRIIYLPCGNRARWDRESEMGYRCMSCFAMVGSIGQPQHCVDEATKWKNLERMDGQGWDYINGGLKKAEEKWPTKF